MNVTAEESSATASVSPRSKQASDNSEPVENSDRRRDETFSPTLPNPEARSLNSDRAFFVVEVYLGAKALAADVKRSLAHQPVSVYRTGAWERLQLWRRRNPVVGSLSLFLAVSLLAGSGVSMHFGLAANREADRANREAKRANAKRDLHDFEWLYWDRLCHSHLLELHGHSNSVASVVISPDGKRLASASAGHPGSPH